mmetsp:Transcript_23388/g.64608  ORF Transcript_23388/g.64608 Transcript_23388/m.64608 type:complete len:219 (+) Transcript_23388:656-1312(+)
MKAGDGDVCDIVVLVHNEAIPLAHAGLLVLDELKALDGAEAAQQLAALLLSQVVGDAAHKNAVLGVRVPRDAMCGHRGGGHRGHACGVHTTLAGAQADGRQVEVGVGPAGSQGSSCSRVVIIGPAHTHADALEHDAVQRHCIARLLHCAELNKGEVLLFVNVHIHDCIAGACAVTPNGCQGRAEEGGNGLLNSSGRQATHIRPAGVAGGLLRGRVCHW